MLIRKQISRYASKDTDVKPQTNTLKIANADLMRKNNEIMKSANVAAEENIAVVTSYDELVGR